MCLVVEQKTSRVRTLPDVASPTRLGLFRKQPQKNCVRKIAQSNLSLYTLLGSTEFATNLDTFDPLVCLLDPGMRIS
jgi:hypothetical protein